MRLGLLVLLAVAATAQNQAPLRGVNLYSVEKEAALGASMARDVRAQNRILDAPAVQEYVDALASKLAAGLRPAGFPFRIAVTANVEGGDAHEPQVLPGGYIFVSGGLVTAARDEAEFAGMLAHSLAHVTERHSTRQVTRETTQQMATIPLIYMGPPFGVTRVLVPAALERSRQAFEVEADSLAVSAAGAAGYDPEAFLRYLTRVQPKDGQVRLQRAQEAVQASPARTYALPAGDEFAQFQGAVREAIPPAREWTPPSLKRR